MSCLNSEIIQRYLDKELSSTELSIVDAHLSSCAFCQLKLQEHRLSMRYVNKGLGELWKDEEVEVPVFELDKTHGRKKTIKYWWWAAAVFIPLLIYMGNLSPDTTMDANMQQQILLDIQYQVDLNSQWHQADFNTTIIE